MPSRIQTTSTEIAPLLSVPPNFPIVGIGASAGGLEAIADLLSNLKDKCGLALLIVQHLDPNHPSLLSEILARRTTLPVVEVEENQLIEQDHVYVIPPNTSMTVSGGRLILQSRDSIPGLPTPIDDLFNSLAEDQGANAIGISLSGSGSDGALGMQAIKGEGGITFAESDSSARFNSMPRAATSLGCVDFIMTPQEIAAELTRIGQQPVSSHPLLLDVEIVAADKANLGMIFQILEIACRHDFSHYKRGTLTRRLARRVAMLNMNSLEEYINHLKENPNEVQALYQDLLIRVTRFFRDANAFEGLVRKVFPFWKQKYSTGESIRIWVPGCSTGEEVYSIAMYLMEFLAESATGMKIQIFGTDVSDAALEVARAGVYLESIANEVSEERLARFFEKHKGQYRINKSLRNLCVFANHNVTCDPPFSQLDLISCRNVLIYFDAVLQKQVLCLFHYALRPGGSLLLGPSETIGHATDLFLMTQDRKFNIFAKRSISPRSSLELLTGGEKLKSSKRHVHKAIVAGQPERQKREIDRIALARFVPAGVLVDDQLNILEFRGDTSPYLIQPAGTPSRNLRQLCRLGLFVEISNMIDQAAKDLAPVSHTAQRVEMQDGVREVALEIIPVAQQDIDHPLFLVFFERPGATRTSKSGTDMSFWFRIRTAFAGSPRHQGESPTVARLQRELDATRLYIKTMSDEHNIAQEDLKVSQEELLSNNEEFQSTNEELETAKEELQSSNEELITTNDELLARNNDLISLNTELKQSRDYAQAIVETIRESLVVMDANLRVVRTNAAFHSTFKLTPEETMGCLFYELDHQRWDIPLLRQLLIEVLPKDRVIQNFEITSEFSNIGKRTMMLNGKHLDWEDETLILLAIEDVTEIKTAQDALRDADKRKDEFLAMLAHELRNPLAPIRNALEIWRRGDAGEEMEKKAQMIMDRQLRKEARLIDDLLDIARITQGSIVLKTEAVDLRQIVTQAVDGTRHQYAAAHHELEVRLPETEVIVKGDPVRLEQIVANLLSNAAKYTKPGGLVILRLELLQGRAVLHVIDNGIGITAEMLPKVFELFVQAEVSLDRSQGGLGIGLALVRRLVELQGGTVRVVSNGINKGSEFLVYLPVLLSTEREEIALVAASRNEEHLKLPTGLGQTPRRVLVVDDNVDAANTTALLLELGGHTTLAVFEGHTALKEARKFKPEIILLDIGLPGMNGYEVARRLHEIPECSATLLIALSGYGHTEEEAAKHGVHFDHHLRKPVDLVELQRLFALNDIDQSA